MNAFASRARQALEDENLRVHKEDIGVGFQRNLGVTLSKDKILRAVETKPVQYLCF